jgi:CheY-like chemotaxis protein
MPKKILLADDSITIQKVVELTLSEGDYQVFSVGNGAQALKKIDEVRPDVALLDVIMPEANGYEVCAQVKRNPETSWIPVLLLTGTFEPFDRKRADAAGANGHITKPFESQMLISKVEELIASSRHPVAEAQRLGRMEIVAGGDTRSGEEPSAETGPAPEAKAQPVDEDLELTEGSIVPDRFDDQGERAHQTGSEGIQTVRLSSQEVLPAGVAPLLGEVPSASDPGAPLEAWDELASDLGTPPAVDSFRGMAPSAEAAPIDPAPSSVPEAESGFEPPSSPTPLEPITHSAEPFPPSGPASPGMLSAADVDRVAARVVEQMSEKVIREIAWEIIPELAESLIRQRIRDLEEKISREN